MRMLSFGEGLYFARGSTANTHHNQISVQFFLVLEISVFFE